MTGGKCIVCSCVVVSKRWSYSATDWHRICREHWGIGDSDPPHRLGTRCGTLGSRGWLSLSGGLCDERVFVGFWGFFGEGLCSMGGSCSLREGHFAARGRCIFVLGCCLSELFIKKSSLERTASLLIFHCSLQYFMYKFLAQVKKNQKKCKKDNEGKE